MSDYSEIKLKLQGADDQDGPVQLRRAITSFLFMLMPVDGETHPKEMERLRRILADDFDLDEEGVSHLIEQSKIAINDHAAVEKSAEILRREFNKEQLLTLISHMWEMVLADGKLHESEVLSVEKVAALLAVTPEEVARALDH